VTTRTIVLGVDGSVGSEAAVKWCVEHAPLLDARVLAMHVIRPVVFIVPPTIFSKPDYDVQAPRAKAAESIESWCAPLRVVEHETRIADGVVADMIMKVAADVEADLVVVGRRGHGGFSELLLGSVPHALSHHCGVPVVIVPVRTAAHSG
jgi:nucleotide-binding universal stress UspA family protein